MEDKKKPDERGRERRERSGDEEDPYTPAVLSEGPKKYRFDDWASI